MEKYMRRALQLAANSPFDTHPNPMVGAVIVADGRIIGEGWHRKCGYGHAEVNAIASVTDADKALLSQASMYVTLEPCSHYGKTPPCAKLIIDTGIPRVVIASVDPFEKVAGRGIQMLRDAGIEVVTGMLDQEARLLNRRFFTAHTLRRPFVTLKWAQSADGFLDCVRTPGEPAFRFSTPLDSTKVHRLRAMHDGIITSASTILADNPRLDCRLWDGPAPAIVIIDRSGKITPQTASQLNLFKTDAPHLSNTPLQSNPHKQSNTPQLTDTPLQADMLKESRRILHYTSATECIPGTELRHISTDAGIEEILTDVYSCGITSLLTECGPRLLKAIADTGMYDDRSVFISPHPLAHLGTAPITL